MGSPCPSPYEDPEAHARIPGCGFGFRAEKLAALRRLRKFSSEGGEILLAGAFRRVERANDPNTLTFEARDLGDLLASRSARCFRIDIARRRGESLNQTVIELLSQGLGVDPELWR
ncbi:MAG: hypothetical protein Q8N53_14870 [Longimicrobiales bacterium]|nr:hypothetical protein [Longimicrobiales bacterium]